MWARGSTCWPLTSTAASLHSLPASPAGTEQEADPSGDDDWWEDALQAVLPWLCGSDGRDILENAPGMLDDADDAEVNMLMRVRQSEGDSWLCGGWLCAGLFNGQLCSLAVTHCPADHGQGEFGIVLGSPTGRCMAKK